MKERLMKLSEEEEEDKTQNTAVSLNQDHLYGNMIAMKTNKAAISHTGKKHCTNISTRTPNAASQEVALYPRSDNPINRYHHGVSVAVYSATRQLSRAPKMTS